jgi:NADH-quinone oxidoreductase subunit N
VMLALLGFPVFGGGGFFAKWCVLQAALQAPAHQTPLAVVLVLTTVVSAGYYLHVLVVMFMRAPGEGEAVPPSALLTRALLAVTVAGLLVLGVYPNWAHRMAQLGTPRVEDASMVGLTPMPRRAAQPRPQR